ncbi:MAG: FAD-binding oxidoreductase, partial [candidate division NC10 bacterium]|nr:FAD-binding oxidoreductase [candidate division NC10 bacterium]
MGLPKTAEIVIVGGGVVGCSIAYHLAKAGLRDVVVLEKDIVGGGTTGRSVGGIRRLFSTEIHIQLSVESLKLFEAFREETGVDPEFRPVGYLLLATSEEEWNLFQEGASLQRRFGVPVELLSPQEVERLLPPLQTDDLFGASYCPTDGYASPHEVTQAYAKGARRLGVRIEEGREVIGVGVEGVRVMKVMTREGPIATRAVVNAAGPFAREVGKMAGLKIPVKPVRRQVFVTGPLSGLPSRVPITIDYREGFYFRREGEGVLFSGPMDEAESFQASVEWEAVALAAAKGAHRLPLLQEAEVIRGWAGLYELSPDKHPILGEAIHPRGYFYAVGFSGHGFMHAPIAGKLMAELIQDGKATT